MGRIHHGLLAAAIMIFGLHAARADAGDAPRFLIGGEAFLPSDIIDARAQPEPDGTVSILISFEPVAAERLRRLSSAHVGRTLDFALGTRVLIAPKVQEPLPGDTMMIGGPFSVAEAQALALAISGKPPLPDSLEDAEE